MSDSDRSARLLKRGLLGGVIVVVVMNVLGFVLDEVGGAKQGPASSSYTTSPEGLAGYADLLARTGHPVVRLRSELTEEAPPTEATVVMLDPPNVSSMEADALRRFVSAGGRLIAGGRNLPGWLEEIVITPPEWSPGGPASAGVIAPAPEVDGLETVSTSMQGVWSDPGSARPVLGANGNVTASVESVGDGRVVLLADPSILHNDLLGTADNAAFGLQAAGESGRPVLFVESIHGYSAEGALSAIPDRWLHTLGGLVLATFVYMWARGRRLGPPEEPHRPLPPPRRDYVVALGGILARTRDVSTVGETLQRGLRNKLSRRAGGARDQEEIERAASAAGLEKEDARVLRGRVENEEDLLILGRAIATLERKKRKGTR